MPKYFWLHSKEVVSQKKLVSVIRIIGNHYQSEFSSLNKISGNGILKIDRDYSYRNGVLKIYKELRRDKTYVTITQIKTFLNPNKKGVIDRVRNIFNEASNTIKIPFSAFDIFEKIIDIILNNPVIFEKCRIEFHKENTSDRCLCRNNLIDELFRVMDFRSNNLFVDQKKIYNRFRGISDKTCK